MIRAVAIAAALVAGGCKGDNCDKRVDAMEARLARAVRWSLTRVAEVELVSVPRDRASVAPGKAVLVVVRHDGLELWGRPLRPGQLAAELADDPGRPIRLAIDRRASMDAVRALAAELPDRELQMVVAISGEEPMPPPVDRVKAVIDRIGEADPSQRVTLLAAKIEAALGDCKAAAEVFGALATVGPQAKGEILSRELPRAVRACRCREVDVPMLEGLVLQLFGAYDPARGWIPLDRARLAKAPSTAALL